MSGAANQPNRPGTPRRGVRRVVSRSAMNITISSRRFQGQLPDERVVWIRRQSKLYLLSTGWPIPVGLLAILALAGVVNVGPGAGSALEIVLAAGVLLYTIYWLFTGFINWFNTYYVLTNQRVLSVRGYFNRVSEDIPLKNVAQVFVDRPSFIQIALRIGDVHVRPIGTPVLLLGVARPREVADSILAVQANPPSASPAAPAGPTPNLRSKKLQGALDDLAKPMPMPIPQPVTRVPFGGLFQRKIPINFIEGEEVIEVVYRHWFVLLVREVPAFIVLAAGVIVGEVLAHLAPRSTNGQLFLIGGVVVGLGYALLIYLNYADDVFVLTTHRVIDIDRLLYILSDYSNDAPYARIQDVHVERNFIGKMLGFGSIKVETSGRKYPVQMTDVPHAFAIMDRIFAQINSIRERENVVAINKQKKENHRWMATVLNELIVEVPDVRGLPLLHAGARVRQAGLKLVVDRERAVQGTPPGRIVDQTPSPGSAHIADDEVRVVLSGRATP